MEETEVGNGKVDDADRDRTRLGVELVFGELDLESDFVRA